MWFRYFQILNLQKSICYFLTNLCLYTYFLGAWFVGNIGRQKGSPWLAILAAYVAYQARWYIYDETMWLTIMSFAATLAFDTFSKEWNREPPKKHGFIR